MKKLTALLLAMTLLLSSACASEAPAVPQEAKTPAQMILDRLFGSRTKNDDAPEATTPADDGMPKPEVYISKIRGRSGGALEITYQNDMDVPVHDITYVLLALNKDGTFHALADSTRYGDGSRESYNTLWVNSAEIAPGKSRKDTYVYNHDYGVKNYDITLEKFPVIAAGVTGWTAADGSKYKLSSAQTMFIGTDGHVIEPTVDPTQYQLLSEEELALTRQIMMGLTAYEVPAYLDDYYDEPTGMWVYRTTSSGYARKAGLLTGDVIISYGGMSAIEPHAAFACELMLLDGQEVEVVYWRNGEIFTTTFQP